MKKVKTTQDGRYIKVKKPDWNLVGSIILDCVGAGRNISGFERECGFGKGFFSKILLGRRTEAMSTENMSRILSKADANCHVTIDSFAAANGLIPIAAAEKLLDSLKPAYKDVPDYRCLEYRDAEFVNYPVPDVGDFDRFAGNLALFIKNYMPDPGLMLRADEIFGDKMLVLSLEKWACHFQSEKMEPSPAKPLAGKYGRVIMDSLGKMGYLPAAG